MVSGDPPERLTPTIMQVLVPAIIVIGLAMLGAFWALADPRAEIKAVRDNYLTIREHTEYRDRVARDIARLEAENARQATRDQVAEMLAERQHGIDAVFAERIKQIDGLRRDIETLRQQLHEHEDLDRRTLNGKQ